MLLVSTHYPILQKPWSRFIQFQFAHQFQQFTFKMKTPLSIYQQQCLYKHSIIQQNLMGKRKDTWKQRGKWGNWIEWKRRKGNEINTWYLDFGIFKIKIIGCFQLYNRIFIVYTKQYTMEEECSQGYYFHSNGIFLLFLTFCVFFASLRPHFEFFSVLFISCFCDWFVLNFIYTVF